MLLVPAKVGRSRDGEPQASLAPDREGLITRGVMAIPPTAVKQAAVVRWNRVTEAFTVLSSTTTTTRKPIELLRLY